MFWSKKTRFVADFLFVALLMAVFYLALNVFYLRAYLNSSFEEMKLLMQVKCKEDKENDNLKKTR